MRTNISQKFSRAALFYEFCLLAFPLDHEGSCKSGRKQAGCGVSDSSANPRKRRKYLAFAAKACSFLTGRKFPTPPYPAWLHPHSGIRCTIPLTAQRGTQTFSIVRCKPRAGKLFMCLFGFIFKLLPIFPLFQHEKSGVFSHT